MAIWSGLDYLKSIPKSRPTRFQFTRKSGGVSRRLPRAPGLAAKTITRIGKIPGAGVVSAGLGPLAKALTFTSDTIETIARKAGASPKVAFASGMILDPLNYLTFGAGFVPKIAAVSLIKIAPKLIKTAKVARGLKYSQGVSRAVKAVTTKGGDIHLTGKAGKELDKLRKAGKITATDENKFYASVLNRAFIKGEKGLIQRKGLRIGVGVPFTKFQKVVPVSAPKPISKGTQALLKQAGRVPGIRQGVIKAKKISDAIFSSPVERLPPGAEDLVDKSRALATRDKEWWSNFARKISQIKDPIRRKKINDIISGSKGTDTLGNAARNRLDKLAREAVELKLLDKKDLKANWLPKLYKQFLDDTNLSFGSSSLLTPDELGRLIKPKKLSKVRRLALGEVQEAPFLASVGGSQLSQLIIKTRLLNTLAKNYGYAVPAVRKSIGKEAVKTGTIPKLLKDVVEKQYTGLKAGQTTERAFIADIISRGREGKLTNKQFEYVGRELLKGSKEAIDPSTGSKLTRVPSEAKYGALSGAYAPEALMDFFNSQSGNPNLPGMLKIFDAFAKNKHFAIITNFFKRGKTILNPGQQFRNIISNQVLSFLEEPASFKAFFKAAKAMKQGTNNKFYRMAAEDGLLDSTFFGGELTKYYKDIVNLGPSNKGRTLSKLSDVWENVVKAGGDLQQGSENLSKMQLYIYALERGASREAAKRVAERAIFAYNKVSPSIRVMRRSGIPFLTFAVKASKQVARTAVVAPGRLAAFPKMERTWNELVLEGIDRSDEKYLPEWMRGMIRTPWEDENGDPLFFSLKYLYPWGSFFEEMGTGNRGIPKLPFGLGAHPLLTLAGEGLYNRHSFFGTPIVDKGASGTEQIQQAAEHVTRQLGPTFPTRFISHVPQSQLGSRRGLKEELLSSVGLKLDPFRVSEERGRRLKEVSDPTFDLRSRLNNLLRQVNSGRISRAEYNKRVKRARDVNRDRIRGNIERFGK